MQITADFEGAENVSVGIVGIGRAGNLRTVLVNRNGVGALDHDPVGPFADAALIRRSLAVVQRITGAVAAFACAGLDNVAFPVDQLGNPRSARAGVGNDGRRSTVPPLKHRVVQVFLLRFIAVHTDNGSKAVHFLVVVQPEAVGVGVFHLLIDILHTFGGDRYPIKNVAVLVAAEAQRGICIAALTGRCIGTFHQCVVTVSADVLQVDLAVLFVGVRRVHGIAHQKFGRSGNLIKHISSAVQLVQGGSTPLIGLAVLTCAAAGCTIEITVAQRSQSGCKLCALAADLAGVAGFSIDFGFVVVLQGLSVSAETLQGHMPAGFLLGRIAVAVSVLIVGIAGRGSMGFLLGDEAALIARDALANFHRIHIQRYGAVNNHPAHIGEFRTGSAAVAFQPQIAGILIIFKLLYTVGLVAGVAEHLMLIEKLLIFCVVLRQQALGEGQQIVAVDLIRVIDQEHEVFIIVALGVGIGAVGDDHVALVAGRDIPIAVAVRVIALSGQGSEGNAVNAACAVTVAHGGRAVNVFARSQLVFEVVTDLRYIQTIHDAGCGIVHVHFGDFVSVKHADVPAFRCFVFQGAVDFSLVVANITNVGAAGNGAGGKARDGTDNLAGLHIHLYQHIGKGRVHIVALVIGTDALQVACTTLGSQRGPASQIECVFAVVQHIAGQRAFGGQFLGLGRLCKCGHADQACA